MEPEGSLPLSQEPSIALSPISPRSILILSTYICRGFPSAFFLPAFILPPIRATCPTHLILLGNIDEILIKTLSRFSSSYKMFRYPVHDPWRFPSVHPPTRNVATEVACLYGNITGFNLISFSCSIELWFMVRVPSRYLWSHYKMFTKETFNLTAHQSCIWPNVCREMRYILPIN
jgi:hypothetical protein